MKKTIIEIIEKIKNNEPLTSEEKKEYILYSITDHDKKGKMSGFRSISTSSLDNVNCNNRSKCESCICSKCYARQQLKRFKTLQEKTHVNTLFYTNYDLTAKDVPFINDNVFRFESLGELAENEKGKQQLKNYYTIARKNRHCLFVLWTKQYMHIAKWHGLKKPGNFRIIASQYGIDGINAYTIYKKYPFVDKVFSVFTKAFAAENTIDINCHGKCIECMKCYKKTDKTIFINEYLK